MSYLWWSFAVLWYNSYNIKLFSLENLSSTGWHHIYMKSTRHHQHLDTQYVRPSPPWSKIEIFVKKIDFEIFIWLDSLCCLLSKTVWFIQILMVFMVLYKIYWWYRNKRKWVFWKYFAFFSKRVFHLFLWNK